MPAEKEDNVAEDTTETDPEIVENTEDQIGRVIGSIGKWQVIESNNFLSLLFHLTFLFISFFR